MLKLFELFHPADEMDIHCDQDGCPCKTLVVVENFGIYVVHAPPPEHEYCITVTDFIARCLN